MSVRVKWMIRMAVGAVAYQTWKAIGSPEGKFGLWLLSHAGFYAFDTGFADYRAAIEEATKP